MISRFALLGRSRAHAAHYIDSDTFAHMAKEINEQAFIDLLIEKKYLEKASLPVWHDFEQTLYSSLALLKHELGQLPGALSALLWLGYDVHNLKILLKMKYEGLSLLESLAPVGNIPAKDMRELVFNQETTQLNLFLKPLVEQTEKLFYVRNQWKDVDAHITRFYFARLLSCAACVQEQGMEAYVKSLIDEANIKIALHHTIDIEDAYIEGGTIDRNTIKRFQTEKEKNILPSQKSLHAQLHSSSYKTASWWPAFFAVKNKEIEIQNIRALYLMITRRQSMPFLLRRAYA